VRELTCVLMRLEWADVARATRAGTCSLGKTKGRGGNYVSDDVIDGDGGGEGGNGVGEGVGAQEGACNTLGDDRQRGNGG